MMLNIKGWFGRSLLIGIYALGVFGILASSSSSGSKVNRTFTCGLSVQGIAPVGDGTVWVGVFAKTNSKTEDRVVQLDDDGSELFSYLIGNGGSENAIRVVARDNTGDIYVGGDFSGGILRLNADGSLDDIDFNDQVGTGFDGRVTTIVPLANGQVYVGGYFTEYNGDPVSGLVRLDNNGIWDNAGFTTVPGVTDLDSVALGVDVPFVDFLYTGGTGLNQLSRWQSNGIRDGTFNPALGPVFSVVPAADATGDIYFGGSFAGGIARLSDTGTDLGFAAGTGFDSDVLSIDRAATGGIYVGGDFTAYNGINSNGVARIDSVGVLDGLFMVGSGFTDPDGVFPFSLVASVVQDTNGPPYDVFVGGGFTQYDGMASNGIVRLNPGGSLDTAFDVSITIGGEVCDSQTIPG